MDVITCLDLNLNADLLISFFKTYQGSRLLKWVNFHTNMDKQSRGQ